jgi:hypothetical protein
MDWVGLENYELWVGLLIFIILMCAFFWKQKLKLTQTLSSYVFGTITMLIELVMRLKEVEGV